MTQHAHLAVQCTASTGETGTFLFNLDAAGARVPVSPVCADMVELIDWMAPNGWQQNGPGLLAPFIKN